MTSEEMTTGSVGASEAERKWAATRTRWWNSTGGGSWKDGKGNVGAGKGNVKAGDGGAKFREEWPEADKENWKWMKDNRIDPATGNVQHDIGGSSGPNCGPVGGLRRPSGSQAVVGAVVEGGRAVGEEGRSWVARNKLLVAGAVIFTYVLIARLLGDGSGSSV
jgi:ubiquitin-conjugating enzyme E2 J2